MLLFVACSNSDKRDDSKQKSVPEKMEPEVSVVDKHGNLKLSKIDMHGKVKSISFNKEKNSFSASKKVRLIFFLDERNINSYIYHLDSIKKSFRSLEIVIVLPKSIDFFRNKQNKNIDVEVVNDNSFINYFNEKTPYALLVNKKGDIVRDYRGVIIQEMLEVDIKDTMRMR